MTLSVEWDVKYGHGHRFHHIIYVLIINTLYVAKRLQGKFNESYSLGISRRNVISPEGLLTYKMGMYVQPLVKKGALRS